MSICVAQTKNGSPCRNNALNGSTLCGIHSRGQSKHDPIVLDDSPPASPRKTSPPSNQRKTSPPLNQRSGSPSTKPRRGSSQLKRESSSSHLKREASSPDVRGSSPKRSRRQSPEQGDIDVLFAACERGDIKMVTKLLSSNHINVNALVGKKTILTRVLCSEMHFSLMEKVVRLLLENGADPNIGSCFGVTPLIHAVHQCNRSIYATRIITSIPIVRLLLKHGANPNVKSMDTTALICAVSNSSSGDSLTKALLKAGADPNLAGTKVSLETQITNDMKYKHNNRDFGHIVPLAAISIEHNYTNDPLGIAKLLVGNGARMNILSPNNQDALYLVLSSNRGDSFSNEAEFTNLVSFYMENGCPFDNAAYLHDNFNMPNNFRTIVSNVMERFAGLRRQQELALALSHVDSELNRATLSETNPNSRAMNRHSLYTRDAFRALFRMMR